MTEVARAFGVAVRTVRIAAGVSQELLAERADCDRTYPSLLERGLRQPTLGKMIDIARALRVEPVVLLSITLAKLHKGDTASGS